MALQQDIQVSITDGGLGRTSTGKDWYSGIVFQNAALPSGFTADTPLKVFSLADAENKGITVDLFPVAHYHISEFFRVSQKLGLSAWISVMFSNISLGAFDGTVIKTIQDANGGNLRHVGVFLNDPYADTFTTGANSVANTLFADGFPVSVYLVSNMADVSTLVDARSLDAQWVSNIISQDASGVGADLYASEGYSIGTLGATMATEAASKVHERTGWVENYDISGPVELQELAFVDGTLVADAADTLIDQLNDYGYTLMVKRRKPGSYHYVDSMTASSLSSDYTEQRFNQVVGKATRNLYDKYAILQNGPVYANPKTGQLSTLSIEYIKSLGEEALNELAEAREINYDLDTGEIPDKSIIIDPDQDVLTTNRIVIGGKISPVGAAGSIQFNISLSTAIN